MVTYIPSHNYYGTDSFTFNVYDSYGGSDTGTITITINPAPDAPFQPSQPSPSNGSTNVGTSPTLSVYVVDPDGDSMDVTFYNASDDSVIGTVSNVANGSTASIAWNNLKGHTIYYWYAIASDGTFTNKSAIWHFTTGEGNAPPYPPQNPSPSNNSINVSVAISLQWDGGDPNYGDEVIYHIYFGTFNPPPFYENLGPYLYNITHIEWNPPSLQPATKYYWQVVAEDMDGMKTYGPIWNFETMSEVIPVTSIVIGEPSYGAWIRSFTPISFSVAGKEHLNATYYRIWHNGVWYPHVGDGYGKDNAFYVYGGEFNLSSIVGGEEGVYYIHYYSDSVYGKEEEIKNCTLFIDETSPSSMITPFHFYSVEHNITINATGSDAGAGIKHYSLYYQYSYDNTTWSEWILYGNTSVPQWNFSMPQGVAYYRFSSVAVDMLDNMENMEEKESCRFYSPDMNGDGRVNVFDLVKIITHWQENAADAGYEKDFNGDGVVDVKDLLLLLYHWTG